MVSKSNLNEALRSWTDRNGWKALLGYSTPSKTAYDYLTLEDAGELVCVQIPVSRIREVESGPDYFKVHTSKVSFSFGHGEVKVVHH